MMMSFCKKSVHSFLGLNAMDTKESKLIPWKCQPLGLVTATGDPHRLPNVLESAAVIRPPPAAKKDPGGVGFIDDVGGGVDGLTSCTESLGFESSDERRAEEDDTYPMARRRGPWTKKWREIGERREAKAFPPPLTSLNQNGQPSFFLRPVRRDGRLELTEVRINRPEILRAHREDGRLRLHLIVEDNDDTDDEDEDEDDCVHEQQQQQQQEDETEEEVVMEEGEKMEDWKFPEGIRRCHEHHHHHMPVWSQHCVTTR